MIELKMKNSVCHESNRRCDNDFDKKKIKERIKRIEPDGKLSRQQR